MTCLKDLTSVVDIKTSSRSAMIGSLTDGSTETFWESGDEDKNKTKCITISCVKGINASNITVHVDNSRDIGVSRERLKGHLFVFIYCLGSSYSSWGPAKLNEGSYRILKTLQYIHNTLSVCPQAPTLLPHIYNTKSMCTYVCV